MNWCLHILEALYFATKFWNFGLTKIMFNKTSVRLNAVRCLSNASVDLKSSKEAAYQNTVFPEAIRAIDQTCAKENVVLGIIILYWSREQKAKKRTWPQISCPHAWSVTHVCRQSLTKFPRGGTPRKIGWGCTVLFPKPLPYLWPNSAKFPPLSLTWPKIRYPIYGRPLHKNPVSDLRYYTSLIQTNVKLPWT